MDITLIHINNKNNINIHIKVLKDQERKKRKMYTDRQNEQTNEQKEGRNE